MAIPRVLELARKYGKSVKEVTAYTDNTGHEAANDLALWEAAGDEIAGLVDLPGVPGKPSGSETVAWTVALTWTAAARAAEYQVESRSPDGQVVVTSWAAGTTRSVPVDHQAGDWTFRVRARNSEQTVGPASVSSNAIACDGVVARKTPAVKKTAANKKGT